MNGAAAVPESSVKRPSSSRISTSGSSHHEEKTPGGDKTPVRCVRVSAALEDRPRAENGLAPADPVGLQGEKDLRTYRFRDDGNEAFLEKRDILALARGRRTRRLDVPVRQLR
jgi:hypothetical protein